MSEITYAWLDITDIDLIAEIDRAESITEAYSQDGNNLQVRQVDWQVPNWLADGEGDHTLGHIKAFCSSHLKSGAEMRGSFLNRLLIGVGILQMNLRPQLVQLAFLHVSRSNRRKGIASRLFRELSKSAEEHGAAAIYVSATPSGSAVEFYLKHGFQPTAEPIAELLLLEPDDIHMVKQL